MPTKNIILTIFTALFLALNVVVAQNVLEKNYFDTKKEFGGEVVLNKSIIKVEGLRTYKIFEIESPENGNYYLNFWMTSGELENFGSGKFSEYEIIVNNEKQSEKIKPEKVSWHNASFIDRKSQEKKAVNLKKGLNQIAFSCNAPEIPDIEFIRLSKDKSASEISDARYVKFVNEIEDEMEMRAKNPKPETDTLLTLKSGIILPNPAGNYYHHIGVTFRYTTYKTYSFTSEQQVSFTSFASSGYEHVLEVFSSSNPETYSWVCKSSSGTASINITIPSTDVYYVKVRAFRQESVGLVNLDINGQYYFANCPVSGSGFMQGNGFSTTYNYFTCNLSGDSHIWIEDNSALPGKIRAYNDNYNPTDPHTFSWGLASRVKKSFSMNIKATLISSASSNDPIGNCDVYIGCQNSDIMSSFQNLYADDAIQSAPASNNYNCISWTGSRINLGRFFWPPDYGNPWEAYNHRLPPLDAQHDLISFTNFYRNRDDDGNICIRDTGLVMEYYLNTYESNASIALWGIGNENYTHASIRNPGNNQPHGYDWESKPGELMRTFHPRDALSGSMYGNIMYYFQWYGTYTQSPSPMKSVFELETAYLSDEKISVLNNLILNTPDEDKLKFEKLYDAWKKTWESPELIIQSNPHMFAKSTEYADLLNYCKSKGKNCWPMIFDDFIAGEELNILLIADLTRSEYSGIMNEIKKQGTLKSAKTNNVPSQHANYVNYISALLDIMEQDNAFINNSGLNNDMECKVFPIPAKDNLNIEITVSQPCNAIISICDIWGNVVKTKNENVHIGINNVKIELDNLDPGFYICNVLAGEKSYINKIQIER